jgi:nuclear receptor coactivator 6
MLTEIDDFSGILSPSGPFLTPSQSPSIQHSPRLQPSPSQSPFQQDVLLVTNNSQHFINTFSTTQEQVSVVFLNVHEKHY